MPRPKGSKNKSTLEKAAKETSVMAKKEEVSTTSAVDKAIALEELYNFRIANGLEQGLDRTLLTKNLMELKKKSKEGTIDVFAELKRERLAFLIANNRKALGMDHTKIKASVEAAFKELNEG